MNDQRVIEYQTPRGKQPGSHVGLISLALSGGAAISLVILLFVVLPGVQSVPVRQASFGLVVGLMMAALAVAIWGAIRLDPFAIVGMILAVADTVALTIAILYG
jgi:hypothetical protein